ncbi:MAG TPA: uL13 family ribosomal protein [Candidatus Paceibacterota bacterium]
MNNQIIIDATGKKLGHIASQTAVALRAKDKPDFNYREAPAIPVKVINISKMAIDDKKLTKKMYVSYTGYPGGLKKRSMASLSDFKGISEPFRRAVLGMLPHNKLRSKIIKNLVIEE